MLQPLYMLLPLHLVAMSQDHYIRNTNSTRNQGQGCKELPTRCVSMEGVKLALLQHMNVNERFSWSNFTNSSIPIIPHKGLENTTVAELLKMKGADEAPSLHWCRTNDTVYDAVKHMTQNNIGALVVVKPGDENLVAGIVTERGNKKHFPWLMTTYNAAA